MLGGGGFLLGTHISNENIYYINFITILTATLPLFLIASEVNIAIGISALKMACISYFLFDKN